LYPREKTVKLLIKNQTASVLYIKNANIKKILPMELSENHMKILAIISLSMLCLVVIAAKELGFPNVGELLVWWGIGGVFLINSSDSSKTRLWKAFPLYVWIDLYTKWWYTRARKKEEKPKKGA
jgi:hypothetical protein